MDLFSRLPAEIRMRIFAFTDLVIRDHKGRKAGIHIYDGAFSNPVYHDMYWHSASLCDCPPKLPAELLDPANNPYYAEIFEVAFAQNRVHFGGFYRRTLVFLHTHIQGTKHIRELEFQFDDDTIEEWAEDNIDAVQSGWEKVINFVRHNLNLSNLTLSLNAAHTAAIYQEQHIEEIEGGDYRLEAYKKIIKPLRGLGQTGGLKRFYVFWGCYLEYETEAEQEVMGESYQAVDKIPPSTRWISNPWRDIRKEKELDREEELAQEQSQELKQAQGEEAQKQASTGTCTGASNRA